MTAPRLHHVEATMTGETSFGWHCLTCQAESLETYTCIEAAEDGGLAHAIHDTLDGAVRDAYRAGAVNALRQYALTIEGGPRIGREAEISDMRDVADKIERGEMKP